MHVAYQKFDALAASLPELVGASTHRVNDARVRLCQHQWHYSLIELPGETPLAHVSSLVTFAVDRYLRAASVLPCSRQVSSLQLIREIQHLL